MHHYASKSYISNANLESWSIVALNSYRLHATTTWISVKHTVRNFPKNYIVRNKQIISIEVGSSQKFSLRLRLVREFLTSYSTIDISTRIFHPFKYPSGQWGSDSTLSLSACSPGTWHSVQWISYANTLKDPLTKLKY